MRCTPSLVVAGMALAAGVAALAQTPTYDVGRTPSAEEIRAWDISIGPAGKELPPGSGTAREGAPVYARKCAACHGPAGEGTPNGPRLVGGKLDHVNPVKTVGSWWPFATTVWDYINRRMPLNQGESLSADEVYALTAVLLYWNGIIPENEAMDARTLPKVQMPNRNGFAPLWPEYKPGIPKPFGVSP